MSEAVSLAISFAAAAHRTQTRKYTGEPYILHPIEVMMLVREVEHTEDMLVAAILHDVVEDTDVRPESIVRLFGQGVADLVYDRTDEFTKENYPELNRKQRKLRERERLGKASDQAKTIKLADLISNTKSIAEHDKDFAVVYLKEKELLLPLLVGGNEALWNMASLQLTTVQSELIWRHKL